jgi:predicted RNA-binding protein
VTGAQAFGGIVRVTGEMYEDRTKIWPGKPGKVDAYPWRFETEPEVVLDEDEFVPAAELAGDLEHVGKWPAEHWTLAFQGQLRTVSDADAGLLERRIRAGARAAA